MTLRAELLGEVDGPRFRMILPEGWKAISPSDDAESELLAAATRRLAEVHRPDLLGQLRPLVRDAFTKLREGKAFTVLMAGEGAPEWAFLPASVIGSIRESTAEASLDEIVRQAIRDHGAVPLGESRQIVRWSRTKTQTIGGEKIGVTALVYLIPVPETKRSRAVQFVASLSHPPDAGEDDLTVSRIAALLDAHISTFQWVRS